MGNHVSTRTSLAQKISKARKSASEIVLPTSLVPASLEEAEIIQDHLWAADSSDAGGWKLGATTHASRQALQLNRAFSGRLRKGDFSQDDISFDLSNCPQKGGEAELAVELGANFSVQPEAYTPGEAAKGVSGWAAALEIPATCYASLGAHGGPALVADNGAAGWAILGPIARPANLQSERKHTLQTRLCLDGELLAEGDAGRLVADPIELLCDHLNRLRLRGIASQKGEFILLGGLTPYVPFDRSGRLEVSVEADDELRLDIDLHLPIS